MSTGADVYKLIAKVSAELAQSGISKDRKNQQQGYAFRGIDDVLNTLAPVISKHGLVILPRVLSRDVVERETKQGGTLFYVTVSAAFDFIAASDGSSHTVQTFGEAMDSADKATNKAQSAAYKYAAILTFCIPTEGDNDADAHTHEPQPRQTSAPPQRSTEAPRQAPPAAASPSAHGAPEGEGWVKVTAFKVAKRGSNDKGPWTLFAVKFSDGTEATTFDEAVAEKAERAHERGIAVRASILRKGDKLTLTNIYSVAA